MTLLTPLGLLGLLGIVALILIYIIKPNYQQKFVSSTYVWKLSLKYRKKKIPINKIRNFLIILCQILILTAATAILAKPVEIVKYKASHREVIAIIDSSASMRAVNGGETRFERAVSGVGELSETVMSASGTVSVIVANEKPKFLVERCTDSSRDMLLDELQTLVDEDVCSYGVSDVESAIVLCESILEDNPEAEVHLYTDTKYSYVPEKINVVNVAEEEEWNVAILNAYSVYEDNFYTFYVDVACYGQDRDVTVNVSISGANSDEEFLGTDVDFSQNVTCSREKTKRIVFINEELYQDVESEQEDVVYYPLEISERVFSYKEVYVYVEEDDSFQDDNNFLIYDGGKEVVKVLYASELPNPFYSAALQNLRTIYADKWDIWYTEVKPGTEEPEAGYSGYDFYLFEHKMPAILPTDGIVFLASPDPNLGNISSKYDFIVNGYYPEMKGVPLQAEVEDHPLLNFINPNTITVNEPFEIKYGSSYETLLSANGRPMLAVCDDVDKKIVVTSFSIHYTNLALNEGLTILLYNMFEYFMPSTVSNNSFEVNEKITLNARGNELYVSNENGLMDTVMFDTFPAELQVTLPGTYTLTQTTFAGKPIEEKIFVRIPAAESNIFSTKDALGNPYKDPEETDYYNDLMKYIAIVMVAILFLEWWLQSRENS